MNDKGSTNCRQAFLPKVGKSDFEASEKQRETGIPMLLFTG
jgi:hypothetical protein